MILYTEQSYDLRSFKGRLSPSRGTYADDIRIAAAQARLCQGMLRTDQVVWCSHARLPTVPLEKPQFIHRIKATQDDIAAVVDGFVWEHIIGHTRFIPPEDHLGIRRSCAFLAEESRNAELHRLEDEYIAENLPGDLWKNVIGKTRDCRLPQYLLHWPFRTATVLDVETM